MKILPVLLVVACLVLGAGGLWHYRNKLVVTAPEVITPAVFCDRFSRTVPFILNGSDTALVGKPDHSKKDFFRNYYLLSFPLLGFENECLIETSKPGEPFTWSYFAYKQFNGAGSADTTISRIQKKNRKLYSAGLEKVYGICCHPV